MLYTPCDIFVCVIIVIVIVWCFLCGVDFIVLHFVLFFFWVSAIDDNCNVGNTAISLRFLFIQLFCLKILIISVIYATIFFFIFNFDKKSLTKQILPTSVVDKAQSKCVGCHQGSLNFKSE